MSVSPTLSDADKQAIEDASENDRLFFERNPGRNHRLRLALPGEIIEAERFGGAPAPTDLWPYVAVKQIASGRRARVHLWASLAPAGNPADVDDEEVCAFVFGRMVRGAQTPGEGANGLIVVDKDPQGELGWRG